MAISYRKIDKVKKSKILKLQMFYDITLRKKNHTDSKYKLNKYSILNIIIINYCDTFLEEISNNNLNRFIFGIIYLFL